MRLLFLAAIVAAGYCASPELESARDRQDRAPLEKVSGALLEAAAKAPKQAKAHYVAALASSYLSEVALEQRDKNLARQAAENGIRAARAAVEIEGGNAEYHRVLGTLCGQVIPANTMAAMQYGRCASEEIDRALQLDAKSALAWVASGVGKYYMPKMFGGSVEKALGDFEKATSLDPKLAEGWLWIGIAQRKLNRNVEARTALEKAKSLNPRRVWIQQQLEKTPAK